MGIKTLAHVSDLHIGKSVETERRAVAIRDALLAAGVDHVVVTGDLTHRGRIGELAVFWRIFRPLRDLDRLTIIPGNHDRLGDDIGDAIQDGPRVSVATPAGLHLIRFDSTAPHNRSWISGHGEMRPEDIQAIHAAASAAAPGTVVAVLLHHHVLPLPADHAAERLVSWLGMPYADELAAGASLLTAVRGHCDLVLHGHRHTPRAMTFFGDERRSLAIYNAGSSTELGRVRVFCHEDGKVLDEPGWLWTWTETLAPLARGRGLRPSRGPSPDQELARIRGIASSPAGEARLRLARKDRLVPTYS
jgi:3',5'-cyclic AMP phosphodiesterase CpdA